MGMLYNAYREGTPLLVTAGQQDRRLKSKSRSWRRHGLGRTALDQVGGRESSGRGPAGGHSPRRAGRRSAADRAGVSVDADGLAVRGADGLDLTPARPLDIACGPRPSAPAAAEVLAAREKPGHPRRQPGRRGGRRGRAGRGWPSDLAPVISEPGTTHGRLPLPADHPLYAPGLPLGRPRSASGWPSTMCCWSPAWTCSASTSTTGPRGHPAHVRLIHLDDDPWQMGKNYPVEVGLSAIPRSRLAELDTLVAGQLTTEQSDAGSPRRAAMPRRGTRQENSACADRSARERQPAR